MVPVLLVSLGGETVIACHVCKQTPCVITPAPAPAFECVTEMVPFTVMKTKTRVDLGASLHQDGHENQARNGLRRADAKCLQASVRHRL